MTEELIFKTNSPFDSVSFDRSTNDWCFLFTDKIYVIASGFWRLIKSDRIIFVSFDNGQQFGRTKPIDLIGEVTRQLTGKNLTEIIVKQNTADLTLLISDKIKIEIFIASSGYESYDLSIYGKRYIGLGSGDIKIIDNK